MFLAFLTLLSALLFSGAFFFPMFLSWGALVGIALLWSVVITSAHSEISRLRFIGDNFCRGILWGGVVFLTLSYWAFDVVVQFSRMTYLSTVSMYGAIVFYSSCTSGLWCAAMALGVSFFSSKRLRFLHCFITTIMYFVWFERWGMVIFFSGDGYPLLNPFIPLCSSRLFVRLVCLISAVIFGPNYFDMSIKNADSIVFIAPPKSRMGAFCREVLEQKIYHQLSALREEVKLVCAPESFFPHAIPLGCKTELHNLWSLALKKDQKCLMGAYLEGGDELYQAALFFDNGPIIKNYVKKHLVPFIEHIPSFWQSFGIKQSIFGASGRCFSFKKDGRGEKAFVVSPNLHIIPRLCSEFIWSHRVHCYRKKIINNTVPVIVWLVDDHWFSPSFRNILQLAGRLKAAWIGLPVFYVGHYADGENNATGWRL